jgi:hypothetical protein
MEQLRMLQKKAAAIAGKAEHYRQRAADIYQRIQSKYEDGNLAPEAEGLWELHRQTLLDANQRAQQFTQQWDNDFPIVASDKAESP